MGLVILFSLGAVIGWLATIALRVEEGRRILRFAIAGVIGSLLAGLAIGNASVFGGVSVTALGIAIAGAAVVVAAFYLYTRRTASVSA